MRQQSERHRDRRHAKVAVCRRGQQPSPLIDWARGMAGVAVAILFLSTASAQVSDGLCACAPSVYEMTLNLAQTCADTGGFGPGVLLRDCTITALDNPSATDLVPQVVTTIDIVELAQNLQTPVGQMRMTGNFVTGDSVTYTSFSSVPGDLTAQNVPKALQLTVLGSNANRENLVMSALVAFSNSCEDNGYPILLEGATTGWLNLVRLV